MILQIAINFLRIFISQENHKKTLFLAEECTIVPADLRMTMIRRKMPRVFPVDFPKTTIIYFSSLSSIARTLF